MSVNMGSAVAYMDLNTKGFDSGIGRVESAWKTLSSNSVGAATKFKTAGTVLNDIGRNMTMKVTAPIVGLGVAATKTAIDFESAFIGVRKTVDTTEEGYSALSEGILEMSKVMPTAATEIAGVMEIAGQLGVRGTDNLLTFTKTMVMLGDTTNLSAEDAATSIARFQNVMGTAAEDVGRIGAAVVDLGNNFATTEAEITLMSQRLAAAGRIAGLTEPEVMALATAMSSVGIEAEAGGTAMTQTLTEMEKAVAGGGEQLEKFAYVAGVTSDQFASAWKNDPMKAIELFIGGLGDLGDRGESATLILEEMGLTGIRQSNMLKSLGMASGLLTEATDTANRAWEENTALVNEANKRYESTASKLKILKNRLAEVGIKFGSIIIPLLLKLVEAVGKVVDWFSNLDEKTKTTILKILGIAAAIGPVLMILGKLIGTIGLLMSIGGTAVGAAVGAVAVVVGQALLIVAAIAGVIAGLVALYKKNEEFRAFVDTTWSEIKQKITAAIDEIRAYFDRLKETLQPLKETFENTFNRMKEQLGPAFTTLIENVRYAFEQFKPVLEVIAKLVGGALAVGLSVLVGVFNGVARALAPLVEIFSSLVRIVGDFWGIIVSFIKGDFDAIPGYFTDIFEQVGLIFKNAFLAIINFFAGFGEAFWETLNGLFSAAGIDLNAIVSGVFQSVKDFFVGIVEWVKQAGKDISDFFIGIGEAISAFFTETIPNAFQSVIDWFSTAIENIGLFFTETIPGWIDSAGEWFESLPEKIGYALGYAVQTVINFGISLWDWLTVELPKIIAGIGDWFAKLPGVIWQWLTQAYNDVVQWGSDTWDKFVEFCTNTFNSIVEWFKQIPGKIESYLQQAKENTNRWANEMVEKVKQKFREFVEKIEEKVREIPEKIKQWMNDAIDWLKGIDLAQIGRDILDSLWSGLKGIWEDISSWFEGIAESVSRFVRGIKEGMSSAKDSRSGSFASGLDYVPRTMTVQVHQGERILTQEQVNSGYGSGVKIDVNVNANVANDVDINLLASKIGRLVEKEMRSRGLVGAL